MPTSATDSELRTLKALAQATSKVEQLQAEFERLRFENSNHIDVINDLLAKNERLQELLREFERLAIIKAGFEVADKPCLCPTCHRALEPKP